MPSVEQRRSACHQFMVKIKLIESTAVTASGRRNSNMNHKSIFVRVAPVKAYTGLKPVKFHLAAAKGRTGTDGCHPRLRPQ